MAQLRAPVGRQYDVCVETLNERYSRLSSQRRYEVWFVRVGLADGSGAWWLRYLLMNPGRGGCPKDPRGMPVQVWATWFPREGKPRSFIQGFALADLHLSGRGQSPFHFRIGANEIGETFCRGSLEIDEHKISWNLNYVSTFRVTLSSKGWIGFSRTPHSDALFSGEITLDDRTSSGNPLGFGVQGHNCGYRHRNFWTWSHAYFPRPGLPATTLEALVYEMPVGMVFHKAVLWHDGKKQEFRNLQEVDRDRNKLGWKFNCCARDGRSLQAMFDGMGPSIHRLPYLKTNCTDTFEVVNNSLASATVLLEQGGRAIEILETNVGAVLEMVG
ncbi:MAG: hypothetical protein ABSE28_22985 [Candidatus Sulfotelmatobacter sp.]|jgi:hypothetical protein